MKRFGLIIKHVSAHTEDYNVGKYGIATPGEDGTAQMLSMSCVARASTDASHSVH